MQDEASGRQVDARFSLFSAAAVSGFAGVVALDAGDGAEVLVDCAEVMI